MTPAHPSDKFSCPNCGKAYRWKPQIAGRKVQCQCSQKFRVPPSADDLAEPIGPPAAPDPEPTTYEIDLDDDPKPAPPKPAASPLGGAAAGSSGGSGGKCPSCGSKIKPEAVICLNCGLNLKEGTKLQTAVVSAPADDPGISGGVSGGAAAAITAPGSSPGLGGTLAGALAASRVSATDRSAEMAEEAAKRHRFEELFLPLIISGVGILLILIANAAVALLPGDDWGVEEAIVFTILAGLRFVIQFPLLFAGIFLLAAMFQASFGNLGTAVLKLTAICLGTAAANDVVEVLILFMTGGTSVLGMESWISLGVAYLTFWLLCAKLFEMEPLEINALFLILIFGPILAMIFFGAALASLFV